MQQVRQADATESEKGNHRQNLSRKRHMLGMRHPQAIPRLILWMHLLEC